MPELPEVETVRRGLAPVMEGAAVTNLELRRSGLRYPFPDDFEETIVGQQVVSVGRRAKYLLVDLAAGDVIIMHLGMSGSFRIEENQIEKGRKEEEKTGEPAGPAHSRNEAHDHVLITVERPNGCAATVIYNDPRRFGFMKLARRETLDDHPTFKSMGVEPVGNALDGAELAQKLSGKKTPLKSALLDQRIVAGLGNIYVCEALWRAQLSPRRAAKTLVRQSGKPTADKPTVRAEKLATCIRDVIADAIKAGGSTLQDHAQTDGSLGYFQHSFAVYGREGQPCRQEGCGGSISRIVQSGRSTFYCTKCQK